MIEDDQYDWFLRQQCPPIIDAKPKRKGRLKLSELTLKEKFQILYALAVIGFLFLPIYYSVGLAVLAIKDFISGF